MTRQNVVLTVGSSSLILYKCKHAKPILVNPLVVNLLFTQIHRMAWNRDCGAPKGGLPPQPPPIPIVPHVCPHRSTQCATARSLALYILWPTRDHSRDDKPYRPYVRGAAPGCGIVVPQFPVELLVVPPPPPVAVPAVHGGARSTVRRLTPNSEFWKEYRSGGDPPTEIDFLGQWESSSSTAQPLDGTHEETDD